MPHRKLSYMQYKFQAPYTGFKKKKVAARSKGCTHAENYGCESMQEYHQKNIPDNLEGSPSPKASCMQQAHYCNKKKMGHSKCNLNKKKFPTYPMNDVS